MPKCTNRVKQDEKAHNYARVYEEFGCAFVSNGDPINIHAEQCPFCDRDKFYLNVQTGQYHCKSASCDASGNVTTFLTWMHGELLSKTTAQQRSQLGQSRGFAPQTVDRHELAYDKVEDRWLIPFKNKQGNVVNIQFYYWNRSKPNKQNLPELPTAMFNLHKLSDDRSKVVFLCEGPFDLMALDYAIGDKHRGRYDLIATPGRMKKEWAEHFRGRKVRALYDNDQGGEQHRKTVQKLLGESRIADELLMLKWPQTAPDGYDLNDFVKEHRRESIIRFINDNSFRFVPEPLLVIHHGRRQAQEDKDIDWIWPNHLRCGTYASFSGEQGTFKTTIALEVAARHSAGLKFPTMKDGKLAWEEIGLPAGHVLYLFAEDDRNRVENGFELAGGNFDHWHCMPAQTKNDDPLNVLDHLAEIEQTIREHNIRLVIIDGQNSVVGAPCIATDMLARNNVSNKLHYFAKKLNICLLGIRNEDRDGRALGPQSFGDIGRCVLRAVETLPRRSERYCRLEFVKVTDTAYENYPPIPYSVENLGGPSRRIIWGKISPDEETKNIAQEAASLLTANGGTPFSSITGKPPHKPPP